jgi:hypothetical protein
MSILGFTSGRLTIWGLKLKEEVTYRKVPKSHSLYTQPLFNVEGNSKARSTTHHVHAYLCSTLISHTFFDAEGLPSLVEVQRNRSFSPLTGRKEIFRYYYRNASTADFLRMCEFYIIKYFVPCSEECTRDIPALFLKPTYKMMNRAVFTAFLVMLLL